MSDAGADTLVIGKIVGCFGIKGWVKIHSYTEPGENLLGYGCCTISRRTGQEPIEFDAGHRQGKGLVAHIKGVDDRTLAESYKGLEIVAAASELPQLEQGEFYWRQLQGLQVWCRDKSSGEGDNRVLLGKVDHLIETGANDVLVVKACAGSFDQNERLIPYLPGDVVVGVDLEEAVINVDWFLDF
ncbi:MAG: ribosome maturation factor RimM [Proteobacteria bacterium]|nr:ribosome maturation factor RimM [Pseudomonadota bacterium]